MQYDSNQSARAETPEMPGREALAALCGHCPEFVPGEVWLVGAGPGDPGLLTLDALAGLVQGELGVPVAVVDGRALAPAPTGAPLGVAGQPGGQTPAAP